MMDKDPDYLSGVVSSSALFPRTMVSRIATLLWAGECHFFKKTVVLSSNERIFMDYFIKY